MIDESCAVRYKQLLRLCGQIVRFGIGIGELLAFHAAVMKKVDMENISNDCVLMFKKFRGVYGSDFF